VLTDVGCSAPPINICTRVHGHGEQSKRGRELSSGNSTNSNREERRGDGQRAADAGHVLHGPCPEAPGGQGMPLRMVRSETHPSYVLFDSVITIIRCMHMHVCTTGFDLKLLVCVVHQCTLHRSASQRRRLDFGSE
jgi:hypothetical protein